MDSSKKEKRLIVSGKRSCSGCYINDCVLLTLNNNDQEHAKKCPCKTCMVKVNCSKTCSELKDYVKKCYPEYENEYGCYARIERMRDDKKTHNRLILVVGVRCE